ncbi:MAG: hypothetical protein ACK4NR_04295 [Micavibrio sp.]
MEIMDSLWLKTQFRLCPDKSRADLARALDLDPPAISKMLAGTRQIKAQEYVAMRGFFGLPMDGQRAVSAEKGYRLEALEVKGLSEPDREGEGGEWVMPAGLLAARTKAAPEQIRIFTVRDKTMEPDFMSGAQVLVDLSDRLPSPPGVFVVSDGVGHILRHCDFVPGESPAQIQISSHKGSSFRLPADKADITGRVIARLDWLT